MIEGKELVVSHDTGAVFLKTRKELLEIVNKRRPAKTPGYTDERLVEGLQALTEFEIVGFDLIRRQIKNNLIKMEADLKQSQATVGGVAVSTSQGKALLARYAQGKLAKVDILPTFTLDESCQEVIKTVVENCLQEMGLSLVGAAELTKPYNSMAA
nr:hypothetical protein BdHM001_34970 [Bdellovibrio sp. HM001]